MRKILRGIVTVVVVIGIIGTISGCGGSTPTTQTTTPAGTTAQPKATTAAAAPTATAKAAQPTAPVTAAPVSTPMPSVKLTGKAQQATEKFALSKGLAVFTLSHTGESNFSVWLLDSTGAKVDLLANVVGDFSGSKPVGIEKAGSYLLDVAADGAWDITVDQPRPTTADSVSQLKGTGPVASQLFSLKSGLTTFKMTHKGESNFTVWLLDANGKKLELLANVVGAFDGSKAASVSKAGIYVLGIDADGDWTATIAQ